ncbi:hypothetical protein [Pseudomonas sp. Root562]|uniref:hypothetical protein n=1 Tax=Pseudomonas sp. Root562 TaxID=1736561 RepID=UPI000703884F|nr:hypothetical protein [Pseudomonas sp. Root562]KQZ81240.1 hypothetical protein ASD60_13145 [Pseudomonas sp. Root562]
MKDFAGSTLGKVLLALLVLFLVLGTLVPLAVLVTYYLKLGSVSADPQDWSAFGSVMSGSFTLLAAASTTATFLLLIWQKKDADKVVAKQMIAMQFEQYVKHRSLFIETLEELERKFGSVFIFRDRGQLYRYFFPRNSAFEMDYKGGPYCEALIDNFQNVLDTEITLVRCKDLEHAKEFGWALRRLNEQLGISWLQADREGDFRVYEGHISYRGNKQTGLNLFNISSDLTRAEEVVSALLEFSGRENLYHTMTRQISSMERLREHLYNVVLEDDQASISFYSESDNRLRAFYELYNYCKHTTRENERFFEPIYEYLEKILSGGGGEWFLSSAEQVKEVIEHSRNLVREIQLTLGIELGAAFDYGPGGVELQEVNIKISKLST